MHCAAHLQKRHAYYCTTRQTNVMHLAVQIHHTFSASEHHGRCPPKNYGKKNFDATVRARAPRRVCRSKLKPSNQRQMKLTFDRDVAFWREIAAEERLPAKKNLARQRGWDPLRILDDMQRTKIAAAGCLALSATCGIAAAAAAHRQITHKSLKMLYAAGACSTIALLPNTNLLQDNITRARLVAALDLRTPNRDPGSASALLGRFNRWPPVPYLVQQSVQLAELELKVNAMSIASPFLFGGMIANPIAFGLFLALSSGTQLYLHSKLYTATESQQQLWEMTGNYNL
jgi:hypothetical protein